MHLVRLHGDGGSAPAETRVEAASDREMGETPREDRAPGERQLGAPRPGQLGGAGLLPHLERLRHFSEPGVDGPRRTGCGRAAGVGGRGAEAR